MEVPSRLVSSNYIHENWYNVAILVTTIKDQLKSMLHQYLSHFSNPSGCVAARIGSELTSWVILLHMIFVCNVCKKKLSMQGFCMVNIR